jgi:hypothetical protein
VKLFREAPHSASNVPSKEQWFPICVARTTDDTNCCQFNNIYTITVARTVALLLLLLRLLGLLLLLLMLLLLLLLLQIIIIIIIIQFIYVPSQQL